MVKFVLSKAQKRALKELSRGVTTFGTGMGYHRATLDALVALGFAEVIEEDRFVCSSASKYSTYTRARITPVGKRNVR